jgi:hypothetical protein
VSSLATTDVIAERGAGGTGAEELVPGVRCGGGVDDFAAVQVSPIQVLVRGGW